MNPEIGEMYQFAGLGAGILFWIYSSDKSAKDLTAHEDCNGNEDVITVMKGKPFMVLEYASNEWMKALYDEKIIFRHVPRDTFQFWFEKVS